MIEITMPQLGEAVTEGTVTNWAKQVGDTVTEDEVLFEVSTDKADSEVNAPADGILSEILVEVGETADVGARVAVISTEAVTETVPASKSSPGAERSAETVVPFNSIRRRTAEHMSRSRATSAHAMVAVEVDYDAVDTVRDAQRVAFREAEGIGLSYLPFLSRAVVEAVRDFPHVNASVGDDELVLHDEINLGIAVDLQYEGLVVPVVRHADSKDLRAIAREVAAIAESARSRQLGVDDLSGGTVTLTNLGQFGTLMTVPIINQPQVAIISTDGVRKRPVVVELPDGTDTVAIHRGGNLVLSWDHRAFEGAYAAAFLSAVRTVLETRDWSTEL